MNHRQRNIITVSIVPAMLVVIISFIIPISNQVSLILYLMMYGLLYHFILGGSKIEVSRYDKKKVLGEILIGIIIIILSLCFLILINRNMKNLLSGGCLLFIQIFFAMTIAICAVFIFNNLIMIINSLKIKHKKNN